MTNFQRTKIIEKQLKLREQLWPGLDKARLWIRTQNDGFTTIPRTMPLLLHIMDALSKGKPVSPTYLELWCRAYDDCFVTITKDHELAFHSGFTGQRALPTWRSRMQILASLEFIDIKPGPSGPISYCLLWNPYHIIKKHYDAKHPGIGMGTFNALFQRAVEIGANDLD
jgi:hypothetical protein